MSMEAALTRKATSANSPRRLEWRTTSSLEIPRASSGFRLRAPAPLTPQSASNCLPAGRQTSPAGHVDALSSTYWFSLVMGSNRKAQAHWDGACAELTYISIIPVLVG